jgi:diaminohydroxyphosphoribosylaminopyrimidine deaminase/5-amino-6-(5-phosphoribosylamino)uracil reductase
MSRYGVLYHKTKSDNISHVSRDPLFIAGFGVSRYSRAMADSCIDEKFMRLALREAGRGVGQTSPNPAVGAVIVQGGKLTARGFHRRAGLPHAEIEALKKTRRAKGATLYVTLEPCSTHGRTPPCVEAIIAAGIARVVIGAIDPNPVHAGRAVRILKKAGIGVTTGVLKEECVLLNRSFNKWITTGLPFVIAKAGLSIDGRLARPHGEGQWITSPAARADAHRLRAQVDAILIGAETLRTDDPRLTVRGVRGARQPWRVVLTRSGNLPSGAHLFTDEFRDRTLVYKNKPLRAVLRDLGKRGVTSVLIEGGGEVIGGAFARRLVDAVQFYIAPLIIGGPKPALAGGGAGSIRIKNADYKKIGSDIRVTGDVEYPD